MIYEVGYLILPTVGEEGLAPEVSKLKETLTSVEAKVIADEYPVLISLQYEMTKRIDTKNARFNQGFFGWIKFEAEGDSVEKIKKQMDLNKAVLRYIIISTVRENTISSKKPLASNIVSRSSRAPKAAVEETLPLDTVAVDQEIDRLVEEVSDEASAPEVLDIKE